MSHAAADNHKAVYEGVGHGNGIAGHLAQLGKTVPGSLHVARPLALGDLADVLRREVGGIARELLIDPLHGTDGHAFLRDTLRILLVTETPDVAAHTIVAQKELAVDDHARAKARAEGDAQQMAEPLRAARLPKETVDFGQCSAHGLTIGEEASVVVDEHGHAEFPLEKRTQGDAASEGGEVGKVADDALFIVGRARESKADGGRRGRHLLFDVLKSLDELVQTVAEAGRHGRQRICLYDFPTAPHGGEHEVRATGIQRKDNSFIVLIVHNS